MIFEPKYNQKIYKTCTIITIISLIVGLFILWLPCAIISICASWLALRYSKNDKYWSIPILYFYLGWISLCFYSTYTSNPNETLLFNLSLAGIEAFVPTLILYFTNKKYVDFIKYKKEHKRKQLDWEDYKKIKKEKKK